MAAPTEQGSLTLFTTKELRTLREKIPEHIIDWFLQQEQVYKVTRNKVVKELKAKLPPDDYDKLYNKLKKLEAAGDLPGIQKLLGSKSIKTNVQPTSVQTVLIGRKPKVKPQIIDNSNIIRGIPPGRGLKAYRKYKASENAKIREYVQNLGKKYDLRYPEGHPKAGLSMDIEHMFSLGGGGPDDPISKFPGASNYNRFMKERDSFSPAVAYITTSPTTWRESASNFVLNDASIFTHKDRLRLQQAWDPKNPHIQRDLASQLLAEREFYFDKNAPGWRRDPEKARVLLDRTIKAEEPSTLALIRNRQDQSAYESIQRKVDRNDPKARWDPYKDDHWTSVDVGRDPLPSQVSLPEPGLEERIIYDEALQERLDASSKRRLEQPQNQEIVRVEDHSRDRSFDVENEKVKKLRRLAYGATAFTLATSIVNPLNAKAQVEGVEARYDIATRTKKLTDWLALGLEALSGAAEPWGIPGEKVASTADLLLLGMDGPEMWEEMQQPGQWDRVETKEKEEQDRARTAVYDYHGENEPPEFGGHQLRPSEQRKSDVDPLTANLRTPNIVKAKADAAAYDVAEQQKKQAIERELAIKADVQQQREAGEDTIEGDYRYTGDGRIPVISDISDAFHKSVYTKQGFKSDYTPLQKGLQSIHQFLTEIVQ
tara:strand:- start:960 stop:2924 length:1965 start_codon:yes stop_codon:yes gene_type:complete